MKDVVPRRSASWTRARALAWVAIAYGLACGVGGAVTWASSRCQFPWLTALALGDIAATVVVFAFSVLFDNSSVYDPYWSVAPIVFCGAHLAFAAQVPTSRAALVTVGVLAWGARLTWNWARGWTGFAHEDWRYRAFRVRFGRGYWPVSLLGIHLVPTAFTFAGSLALAPALLSASPLGLLDVGAIFVTSLGIALETVADQQLRRFTLARARGERAAEAICAEGLWARSRHPNYLGEILFWWGVWLFGVSAAPAAWAWTLVGPLTITAMFVFVTLPMMDRRHLARRPAYGAHMRRVPSLIGPGTASTDSTET